MTSVIHGLSFDRCAIGVKVSVSPDNCNDSAGATANVHHWRVDVTASQGRRFSTGQQLITHNLAHELGHIHHDQHFLHWLRHRRQPSIHRQKFPDHGSLGLSVKRIDRYLGYGLNLCIPGRRRIDFNAWEENYAEAFMWLFTKLHVRRKVGHTSLAGIPVLLKRSSRAVRETVLEGLAPTIRLIELCMRQRGHPLSLARRRQLARQLPKR